MTPTKWAKRHERDRLRAYDARNTMGAGDVAAAVQYVKDKRDAERKGRASERDYINNHILVRPDADLIHILDTPGLTFAYTDRAHLDHLLRAELRRRDVRKFMAQHDCGPEREWDDDLRFMFDISYPPR